MAIATETMTTERMSAGATLARLLAFDTASRNPNTGLIDFSRRLADRLAG